MGTSLSGLTPATTFDGLLKTSDNDAITSSLKTIGSGDGTDSCLQLSNSALKVNSGEVTIVGTGNTGATSSLLIQNSSASDLLRVNDSGEIRMQTLDFLGNKITSLARISTSGLAINNAGTSPDANTQLHIKGSGATSATTSLLVQNSSGTNVFKVVDDNTMFYHTHKFRSAGGYLYIEGEGNVDRSLKVGQNFTASSYDGHIFKTYDGAAYSEAMRITGANDQFVGIGEDTPTARLHVKGSGATSATTSLLVQNSAGSNVFSITDDGLFTFNDVGANIDALTIENNNNISKIRYNDNLWLGSSHGTYAPTLKIDRLNGLSVETNSGSLLNLLYDTGNLGIGETTPSAKLHVKAGTTQDSIAKFEDPRATTDYIEIKNDSTLTDYTGLYWGTAAKIRSKQTGAIFLDCTSGILFADGNSARSKIDANGNMSIGTPTIPASTRVTIKGQGATSATTSLLVQNSDGTEHLKITDDGAVDVRQNLTVNHATNSLRFLRFGWGSVSANDTASELSIYGGGSNNGSIMYLNGSTKGTAPQAIGMKTTGVLIAPSLTQSSFAPSAQLHVKGAGNDATTTALLVENSDGTSMFRIKDSGYVDVNPTNSAGGSLQVRGDSTDYLIFVNANDNYVGIGGTQSSSSVRAYIKGKGATSATTALLVENSSGTDTLEVRDDGRVVTGKGATTNANGTFNVLHGVSNLTTRVFTVSRDSVLRGMDINSGGATKISDSSGDQSFSHTATAVLEVSSTTQGFLPPRMTGEQIDAIESPASGLIIYNTTSNKAVCYNGTSWNDMF